jgi:hypothetical protein
VASPTQKAAAVVVKIGRRNQDVIIRTLIIPTWSLPSAELTDMVTRAVEFVMLFGLWAFMTLMSFSGSKAKQQGLSLSVFLAFFLFI